MIRWAHLVVRVASGLVPGNRRREWMEEWTAELDALARLERSGTDGLPSLMGFAAGALPHALWTRTEGWTMDSVIQDLKYAGRVLRSAPGFTMVAALTLALGIGANASIFSLINGLLLRAPGGIHQPERLVQIARSYESAPRWDNFSWPAMDLIARESRTLSGVAGFTGRSFTLGTGTETEQIPGEFVTGSYFDVLGVTPHVGRLLQAGDDVEPGAHPVVVLSHALWTRRYGSDPAVVGGTISLGAAPYQVVGVAPEGFLGAESIGTPPEVWVPIKQAASAADFASWGFSWIYVVGRMAEGVTFQEAEASMAVVSNRLREATPENDDMLVLLAEGVGLDPGDRREARQLSWLLLLIVGVVLLLTCTNVANLYLARASGRRAEMGVRMALGAGRGRLARQLITESLLLAGVATLLAVPAVLLAGRFVPLVFPYTLSVPVGADGTVLLFLCGVGLLAGVLFGFVPAWVTAQRDVADTLRDGASTGGRNRTRLRDGLVVAQLGLSLGLVSGAALLGRSVMNAHGAQPGFNARGVAATQVNLSSTGRYDGPQEGLDFFRRLTAEAVATPGVAGATLANQVPIAGGHSRASVRHADNDELGYEAEYMVVGGDYFSTLGIPIVSGRPLGGIGEEPERVMVVNEALARMFWPGEAAVGQQLDARGGLWTVVGVAGDVQMRSLREAGRPAVYYPLDQQYSPWMVLHVVPEPGATIPADRIQQAVANADPELPAGRVIRLDQALVASMGETRTVGYLVAAFAGLALILAVVGLYGLVSYGAAQRVREVGIRIALGAQPESLVRLFLRRGLALAVVGVGAGLLVAWAMGRALQGLLFGVAPSDPLTLAAAAAFLLGTATMAAWLPAQRASRTDAAVSLRD